jgi:hypothetical protein
MILGRLSELVLYGAGKARFIERNEHPQQGSSNVLCCAFGIHICME